MVASRESSSTTDPEGRFFCWAVMASRGRTIGFSDPGHLRAGRASVAPRGRRASAAASGQRAELLLQRVLPPDPGETLGDLQQLGVC